MLGRIANSSARSFDVAQARRFALQSAQIIQLGAADFGRAQQIHLVDYFRVDGENAFHALAEANLADGEAGLWTVVALDDDAFKRLQAFLVAFFDLHVNADRVARVKRGNVSALSFRQQFSMIKFDMMV